LRGREPAKLGALYVRLRDTNHALEILQAAKASDPRNFWALTHLGTLYQITGQLQEAASHLEAAGDYFPAPWLGALRPASGF